jgi:5-methylcytosine-specific restriction protein A
MHPPPADKQTPPGTSWRTVPLPPDWHNLRRTVLKRDGHQCTWHHQDMRCTAIATDVDHIGDPADHDLSNLRSLCGGHHDSRTGRQAATARWARHRERAVRAKPKHPGIV